MSETNCQLRRLVVALIVSVALSVGHGQFTANAQSAAPQTAPAPGNASEQEAQAMKALNDPVTESGGMQFPAVGQQALNGAKLAAGAHTQGVCTPGETRTHNKVAAIEIVSPKGWPKNRIYPQEGPVKAIYSTPADGVWVISSYNRVVTAANQPFVAHDAAFPPNFKYLSASEYQSVFEDMKNYVLKLDVLDKYKAELNLKLENFVKNYGKYSVSISASHGMVEQTAYLNGRGIFNGSSEYRGHLTVTEVCAPAEIKDAAQLKETLKEWVDGIVPKLPKRPWGPRPIDTRVNPAYRAAPLSPQPELKTTPVKP